MIRPHQSRATPPAAIHVAVHESPAAAPHPDSGELFSHLLSPLLRPHQSWGGARAGPRCPRGLGLALPVISCARDCLPTNPQRSSVTSRQTRVFNGLRAVPPVDSRLHVSGLSTCNLFPRAPGNLLLIRWWNTCVLGGGGGGYCRRPAPPTAGSLSEPTARAKGARPSRSAGELCLIVLWGVGVF